MVSSRPVASQGEASCAILGSEASMSSEGKPVMSGVWALPSVSYWERYPELADVLLDREGDGVADVCVDMLGRCASISLVLARKEEKSLSE